MACVTYVTHVMSTGDGWEEVRSNDVMSTGDAWEEVRKARSARRVGVSHE